jgi:hypothetical protein
MVIPPKTGGIMCIEANKHGSQENSIMTNKENSNNKPGLALFTLEYDIYDETYTYITALPYKGKLKGYINRIAEESASFGHLAYDASASSTIYVETSDFDTYAEAKAAAQGATFMDAPENAGMSPIGEVDAEKLQKAIEIMKRIRGNIQLTGDNSQDKKNLRDAVLEAACKTGLWYNPND